METKNNLKIIILNGAYCTGKSSLIETAVEKFVEQGTQPIVFSTNELYGTVVTAQSNYLEEYEQKNKETLPQPIEHFFSIFHHQILARLNENNDTLALVEHCFLNHNGFLDFLHQFQSYIPNIAFVKIFCSYEVAKKRLKKANTLSNISLHREKKYFKQHYDKDPKIKKHAVLYENKEYDYELDTSNLSPEECLETLIAYFQEYQPQQNATFKNFQYYLQELRDRYEHKSM